MNFCTPGSPPAFFYFPAVQLLVHSITLPCVLTGAAVPTVRPLIPVPQECGSWAERLRSPFHELFSLRRTGCEPPPRHSRRGLDLPTQGAVPRCLLFLHRPSDRTLLTYLS